MATCPAATASCVLLWLLAGCISRGSFGTGSVAGQLPASPVVPVGSTKGTVFMLDNFEREGATHGEDWSTFADKGGLRTTAVFKRVKGGAQGSNKAASFSGYLGSAAPPYAWSVLLLNMHAARKPVDLSAVRALRFWVKGDGHRYKVALTKASSADQANYQYVFDAPATWTQIEVPLELLTQPEWGQWMKKTFDDVVSLDFQPQTNNANYDLLLDNVEFVLAPDQPFPYQAVGFVDELAPEILAQKTVQFTPIALDAVANRGYEDDVKGDGRGGWTDQGENSVPNMPTGLQTMNGVPFLIPKTPGKQVVVLAGQNDKALPKTVEIPVKAKAPALYFLHASAWAAADNGQYVVHYSSGSTATIPVRDKIEVFDFWTPDESPVARPGWIGRNKVRDTIGLTLFAWKNPHPNETITSIVASTKGDGAYLMLSGITLASEGPYLPKSASIAFEDEKHYPYDGINVTERHGTALDMSGLLDAPAGKHGVLKRKGESFEFSDGTAARFWGMSISDQANFPNKEQAEFMADLASQLGFNMTRHHLMDAHWSDHNIFGLKPTSTQQLDPEWLDRFDYFVAQLQKRGIYQYLDLIVQRKPMASDGVQDAQDVEPGYKMVGSFDEVLIANQERYAQQLLSHRNKYTGKTYAEDPAIVMMEITNESTLFYLGDWGQGELRSQYHKNLLTKQYNRWLKQKVGDRAVLQAKWAPEPGAKVKGLDKNEDPGAGTVQPIFDFSDRSREYLKYSAARVQDNVKFLAELELAYYRRLTKVIRKQGYKGLITGTNHWLDQPMDELVNATTDYIDRHAYWAHPLNGAYQYKSKTNVMHSTAAVQDPQSLVGILAAKRVKGLPYIITEWNSCHPLYRVDALLMMAAYANLHGWSALQYSLSGNPLSQSDQVDARLDSVFDLGFQASILGLWPATALLVHRGDVRTAETGVWRPMDDQEAHNPATRVGLPDGLAYVTRSGMDFTGEKADKPAWKSLIDEHVKGKSATSTTGELKTDWGSGVFHMDSPRSQGAAGFLGGKPQRMNNLRVELTSQFGAVVASSLDKLPLAQTSHILITAVGNTVNSGMEVSTNGVAWRAGGNAPILVEQLTGQIQLFGLQAKLDGARVFHLSASGKRRAEVPHTTTAGSLTFDMKAEHKTMHYEVVLKAKPTP